MSTWPRTYRVSAHDRQPLLEFITDALEKAGCRVLVCSPPTEAPFKISFETASGERLGIVVYAFRATSVPTRNRPADEFRFQVKYGSKDGKLHDLWQDPAGLYVTLFLGIDLENRVFVGADPVLHSPTKFFISIEFKKHHVEQCVASGWCTWERDHRGSQPTPVEVLVGGTADSLLRYIRFEREALGEDQGHRQLIAERFASTEQAALTVPALGLDAGAAVAATRVHELAHEFELSEHEVLDLITSARRLKMAVRGWVAEEHLVRALRKVPGVTNCVRLDEEGGPDVRLCFEGSRALNIECKNVLRKTTADGVARIDFQRTRASKSDKCSRYYGIDDFDVVAACVHAVTEEWQFKFTRPVTMAQHLTCPRKLSNNVKVGVGWTEDAAATLRAAARA
ncbi:MAG TPA: hypothetical protein VEL07_09340 [Planctomycetota bacterium]|nr:hypothetical protein [Planctomycetota bacterium]